ncbi:tyrosine-protein phosphatase [Ramlibacter albus]|uniref:Tyrosine-protein phosphatase n=1 Tax=Ramlibacter albus TaxID=2079448 RepID=A0A923S3W0_9BURK|nr:tyrosine-protein phosphatase [Ramlibacter albus]MBC5766836.1 tyrosine-protein phosphatase [Ramlibacter albus]
MPAQSPSFPSAANFRDLADHVPERFRMRRHTLFRSDHLGALNEYDAGQIQALGIRRVLDFRGVDERTSAACVLPDVTLHSLSIEPTIVQKLQDVLAAGKDLTEDDVVMLMQDTYRGFVRTSTHRFAEFFALLLESNEPTVFHCTAGKDRTGFAAALFLYAMGVPQDVVMRDYMHTNDRLRPPPGTFFPEVVSRVLYRVQPEFLDAAFEAIEQDYGSMDAYLLAGLRLRPADRARLSDLYRA